eukprot:5604857-Pyramimonas_sp.AAC.1
MEVGYARNQTKQELQMYFHGLGAATRKRWARSHPEFLPGLLKDAMRYLGPMLHANQSVETEVNRRCAACADSFYSLGRVWSLSLPHRWFRILFLSYVQNAALSGIEPLLLAPNHCKKVDGRIARFGRRAMQGRATRTDGDHVKTMATKQILAYWRIPESDVEMTIRRLSWCVGWARDPQKHSQELCL